MEAVVKGVCSCFRLFCSQKGANVLGVVFRAKCRSFVYAGGSGFGACNVPCPHVPEK